MITGLCVGIILAVARAHAVGLSRIAVIECASYIVVGWAIGGKLLYVLSHTGLIHFGTGGINELARQGFALYGGFIGVIFGCIWYSRKAKISAWRLLDLFLPGVIIAQGIGKLGCHFNGCCLGYPESWGIIVPGTGDGILRVPVQLLESGGYLAIGFLAIFLWSARSTSEGNVAYRCIVASCVWRFIVGFWRVDASPWPMFGTWSFQVANALTCIPIILVTWIAWQQIARKHNENIIEIYKSSASVINVYQ
jgi:phosphatidylglycerol:prolipoprotein diacylglycerol transferase